MARPAVAQQLKVLLDAGLVSARAEGTMSIFSVNSDGFLRLIIWLDEFWDG